MLEVPARPFPRAPESVLASQLDAAREILRAAEADAPAGPLDGPPCSPEFERIRWFPLPSEARAQLRSAPQHVAV
jgi:hypothetical protein